MVNIKGWIIFFLVGLSSSAAAQKQVTILPDPSLRERVKISSSVLELSGNRYGFSVLDTAIRNNKVLILGESHWMSGVHKIITDLVFYANTKDHFPLLVLEKPYSYTAFIHAYLEADSLSEFKLLPVIKTMFGSDEGLELLGSLKKWNAAHPNKKINIGCSDIEHGLGFSLKNVFDPFFKACGKDSLLTMIKTAGAFTSAIQSYMESVISGAPETTKVPGAPFLNLAFIKNVWTNIRGTVEAGEAMDKDGYEAYLSSRIKRIYTNLTDTAVFGKSLQSGKAILWVGATHSKLYADPADKSYLPMEGALLDQKFAATKDKVFSLRVTSFAYAVSPEYYNSDVYSKGGEGFVSLVDSYKETFPIFKPGKFRVLDSLTRFSSSLTAKSASFNYKPVFLRRKNLLDAAKQQPFLKKDAQWNSFIAHDAVIVVPMTELFRYSN